MRLFLSLAVAVTLLSVSLLALEKAPTSCHVITPLGHINVSTIEPSSWVTDVLYPLGFKVQWRVGLSPCNQTNKTLPVNTTCDAGYAFFMLPNSQECTDAFTEQTLVWWSNGAEALKYDVIDPATGRAINVTLRCNQTAPLGIKLTAPIRTADGNTFIVSGESRNACPAFSSSSP